MSAVIKILCITAAIRGIISRTDKKWSSRIAMPVSCRSIYLANTAIAATHISCQSLHPEGSAKPMTLLLLQDATGCCFALKACEEEAGEEAGARTRDEAAGKGAQQEGACYNKDMLVC
eukprot:1161670-Pelagomonas_calceolata.AAC.28